MPTKPSRTTRKTRKRSTRKKKSTRVTRVVVITAGFLVLLFFTLYGLNYLKQNSTSDLSSKRLSATEVDNLIKDIDQSLTGHFLKPEYLLKI